MTELQQLPVSVVIPAYRCADYIVECVGSVLAGPVVPREVIVVDDGSPDDTGERVAPLVRENRIRYVSQDNAGVAAARNAGAALASSEYLFFLDADDVVYPGALSSLFAELERHPDAAMACGEMVIFSGEPPAAPEMSVTTRPLDRTAALRFNPLGSPGQVMIRRSIFDEVGGFHSGFPGTEDWDLWLRLLENHAGRWVCQPIIAYRLHATNMSGNVARMYQSSLRVARRHLGLLPASQRVIMRSFTYRALRSYHTPRLEKMALATAARGEWRLAIDATRAWIVAWTTDVSASLRLKAHLVAQGRWRLSADEQLS